LAVLQQRGYRTVEASQAEEGWLAVRELHPACVVLDYALASGDGAGLRTGWDLAQRMTTERSTRHVPMVFVTGFDGELQDKLKSTAFARHPEHLVKPIDTFALLARIESLIGESLDRPARILMADDDPSVAAYVRKVLPRDRFDVRVTQNGEQCLHALRIEPTGYDLLLLDLMMPGVSGYDVLREMTLTGLQPDLPVLVLTNFPEARDDEERRLLERGLVIEVLAKTAVHEDPGVLPRTLARHLSALPGFATYEHDARGMDGVQEAA
jgi:CheY-like chemotaxis protein